MKCSFCKGKEEFLQDFLLPRNLLIEKKRKILKLTQDELGDRIGFETIAIKDMEIRPDFLESWSYELVAELSTILEIPIQILLNVKCVDCNK